MTKLDGDASTGHVFISYVREDAPAAKRLAADLEEGGVEVWIDRDRIYPGEAWQAAIRQAIESGAFFIACFSKNSLARERSYMNAELAIAIDELRMRPRDRAWFLPVKLDDCTVPKLAIGGGETLHDRQYVALYDRWQDGVNRLRAVIDRYGPDRAESQARDARFKRPVSATYVSRRELFENFIEAAMNVTDHSVPDQEIRRRLQVGAPVPSRYLYSTPSGATQWLRLCRSPENQYHLATVDFWQGTSGQEIAALIRDRLGRDDFDYVSLGCGDGRKDAALLGHWLRAGADLTYYPYDISQELLLTAIRLLLDVTPAPAQERLHVKALLADFDQLGSVHEAFRQRSSPNVFGLLGNSLANHTHELQLLHAVRDGMSSEDLLVLEIRLISEEVGMAESSDEWKRFFFGPLAYVGVPFEPSRMSIRAERALSPIPGAVTQVVGYDEVTLGGARISDVTLAYVHSYRADEFLSTLTTSGFDVLYSTQEERFLVCAVRLA